jgi:hypothetical protein
MFIGSMGLVWILIVRMPADFLTRDPASESRFSMRHPVVRTILTIVKNLGGAMLVVAGVVMLLTPGQGLLSIFVGITLLDFPGKPQLIRRMLGRHGTVRVINKIRQYAGRPPLKVPSD